MGKSGGERGECSVSLTELGGCKGEQIAERKLRKDESPSVKLNWKEKKNGAFRGTEKRPTLRRRLSLHNEEWMNGRDVGKRAEGGMNEGKNVEECFLVLGFYLHRAFPI